MYIVIELMDFTYPTIVTNEDGEPAILENEAEAVALADECQNGQVVKIRGN